jgi:hypothetical protein
MQELISLLVIKFTLSSSVHSFSSLSCFKVLFKSNEVRINVVNLDIIVTVTILVGLRALYTVDLLHVVQGHFLIV